MTVTKHPASVRLQRSAVLDADMRLCRALSVDAIHGLHELTVQHDRLCEQHHRLRDELRNARMPAFAGISSGTARAAGSWTRCRRSCSAIASSR